jgi:hypothetical protein
MRVLPGNVLCDALHSGVQPRNWPLLNFLSLPPVPLRTGNSPACDLFNGGNSAKIQKLRFQTLPPSPEEWPRCSFAAPQLC